MELTSSTWVHQTVCGGKGQHGLLYLTTGQSGNHSNAANAESVRREAKVQSILLQHFMSKWKHEYLTSLREFYRPSRTSGQQVNVGDIVLLHDDCPWINWKMAVVKNLVKGNDGLVRSVNIWTKNGVTNRPVSKLYPLELSEDVSTVIQGEGGRDDSTTATAPIFHSLTRGSVWRNPFQSSSSYPSSWWLYCPTTTMPLKILSYIDKLIIKQVHFTECFTINNEDDKCNVDNCGLGCLQPVCYPCSKAANYRITTLTRYNLTNLYSPVIRHKIF